MEIETGLGLLTLVMRVACEERLVGIETCFQELMKILLPDVGIEPGQKLCETNALSTEPKELYL
jgi:hypothetical protein